MCKIACVKEGTLHGTEKKNIRKGKYRKTTNQFLIDQIKVISHHLLADAVWLSCWQTKGEVGMSSPALRFRISQGSAYILQSPGPS